MILIRPEVRKGLYRWREVILGGLMALWGLSWAFGAFGLIKYLGVALVLLGGGILVLGLQRARFRRTSEGVGMVQVDEGQITYFGPLSGGTIDVQNLERLTLSRDHEPAHWHLKSRAGNALFIPVNADGNEALFDAFATLPRFNIARMLKEMNATGDHVGGNHAVVIWERQPLRPQSAYLH